MSRKIVDRWRFGFPGEGDKFRPFITTSLRNLERTLDLLHPAIEGALQIDGLPGGIQHIFFDTASGATTGFISSTSHATKGKWFLNEAKTITVDEANVRLGIGVADPDTKLTILPGIGPTIVDGIKFRSSDNSIHCILQAYKIAADTMTLFMGSNVYRATGAGTPTRFDAATASSYVQCRSVDGAVHVGTGDATADPTLKTTFGVTEFVVNDDGLDYDTRIEGVAQANLFFADASTARIGVGTGAPATLFHVAGISTLPTVLGGSGTTSTLTLQTTSGVGAAGADMLFKVGNAGATEAMRILNAGTVGIGTTSPNLRLGQLLDIAVSANFGGQSISAWTTAAGQAPILDLKKSKSATIGTHSIVASGDALGFVVFRGSDGVAFLDAAYIKGVVDGAPGVNVMPGRLEFYTSNTTPAQLRATIDNAGNFGLGATSFGTSAAKVFAIGNGTAPTTSPADMTQLWAADTVAGQSNLYARNENGKSEQLTGLADRVTTQFDSTSDTTLSNITGLSHNVEASKAYAFRAVLYTTSDVAGGIKAAIAGTATATSIVYESLVIQTGTTVATTASRSVVLGGTVANVTAVTVATVIIEGTILVNAAGTLTVQFAQNASSVTATSVLVNSTFVLTPIGD